MYFQEKNILKNNHYFTIKKLSKHVVGIVVQDIFKKYFLFKNI